MRHRARPARHATTVRRRSEEFPGIISPVRVTARNWRPLGDQPPTDPTPRRVNVGRSWSFAPKARAVRPCQRTRQAHTRRSVTIQCRAPGPTTARSKSRRCAVPDTAPYPAFRRGAVPSPSRRRNALDQVGRPQATPYPAFHAGCRSRSRCLERSSRRWPEDARIRPSGTQADIVVSASGHPTARGHGGRTARTGRWGAPSRGHCARRGDARSQSLSPAHVGQGGEGRRGRRRCGSTTCGTQPRASPSTPELA